MAESVASILRTVDQAWLMPVWVQPGARQDVVIGIIDGCLKLRIKAPAVDNKANAAVTALVAEHLGLRRNQVRLVSGLGSRRKMVHIVAEQEPDWERLAPSGMR